MAHRSPGQEVHLSASPRRQEFFPITLQEKFFIPTLLLFTLNKESLGISKILPLLPPLSLPFFSLSLPSVQVKKIWV